MKKSLFTITIASSFAIASVHAASVTQHFSGSIRSNAGSFYSSEKLTLDGSEVSGVLSPLTISGVVHSSGNPVTKSSSSGSVSISITTEKASSSKITNALILQSALGTASIKGYSLNIFTEDDTDTIVAAKKNGKIIELTPIGEELVALTAGENSLAISSAETTKDEELSASSSTKLKDITVTIDNFADMPAVATHTEIGKIITTVAKTAESDAETAYTTFTAINAPVVSGFATVETETSFAYEETSVIIGTEFESTPTVENGPTFGSNSWSATGLPTGLKIDPSTGKISGTVETGAALTYSVKVRLKNAYGTFTDNVPFELAAE